MHTKYSEKKKEMEKDLYTDQKHGKRWKESKKERLRNWTGSRKVETNL